MRTHTFKSEADRKLEILEKELKSLRAEVEIQKKEIATLKGSPIK